MNCPREFTRPLRIPENVEPGLAEPVAARAGERGSWRLRFVVAKPVPADRRLWLHVHGGRHNKNTWPGLQADDAAGEGYVALKAGSGERLEPVGASADGGVFSFRVPEGGLTAGARLTAELRDTVAPVLAMWDRFFLLLSAGPEEELKPPHIWGETAGEVAAACLMHVVGNAIGRLAVHAPSRARPGEPVSLLVRPEDEYGNVASEQPGRLVVRVNGAEVAVRREPVEGSTCCRLSGIALPAPGIYRLRVEEVETGRRELSNPIACAAASPGVLWGVIHGHTEISDGLGSLDHYFRYMREECGLDFGGTGDHDSRLEVTEAMWRLTQEAVVRYNAPGRFTTFLGYEWATWRKNGDGDRNVYYLHDGRPIFRSGDDDYPKPADLFDALAEETAIIIPHHTAEVGNPCDWKDHEPEKERLVEIYSMWGNSERSVGDGNPYPVKGQGGPDSGEVPAGFVQRALELGWRVGFTAGGDDHTGHSGDQVLHGLEPWRYRAGLLAVPAGANTREAIWEALWNRRCYGTTGARILVDFRLNGHPMGAELSAAERPERLAAREFGVRVHGTAGIRAVEIVRNNREVYGRPGEGLDAVFAWTDTEPLAEINLPPARFAARPFTFYYLRVTQEDGQMAWASPIWITA